MKVTLAYPYTDPEGKAHDADETVELVDDVASSLIADGRARTADTTTRSSKKGS